MALFWLIAGALCLPLVSTVWYENAIIYQLYPRSFKDTDGDGIGDLRGVLEKVDYLASLGIDAVWFSPPYPSPNVDFGYDISDFIDINPEYGTLKDFDDVVNKLKEKGIRVLLDFVPNHSSTEHRWFKLSEEKIVEGEVNYTDFYVWKNPKGYDNENNPIPPNNWLGVINTGSAWKWSEKRKQFYLHNFLEPQGDLNYANPAVRDKMKEVLVFWMRRGVIGFRVDAMSWVWEDQSYKDEPKSKYYNPKKPNDYNNLDHIYTQDLPENIDIVKDWRATLDMVTHLLNDTEERVLILESYSPLEKLIKYYGDSKTPGATFPFNFLMLLEVNRDTNATAWADSINSYYKAIGNHWPNWVLGNHDQFRVANRWSNEWVDVLHILMMTLRGTAVSYYGEEIGLDNNMIRWDQTKDIQGIAAGKKDFPFRSRDFERGPMPWNSGSFGGFTNGTSTWIPLATSYYRINVELEENADVSHLKVYQALAKLRKTMTLTHGSCQVNGTDDGILYVIRTYHDNPTYISIVNIGDSWTSADVSKIRSGLPDKLKLKVASINFLEQNVKVLSTKNIILPPKSGVVVTT